MLNAWDAEEMLLLFVPLKSDYQSQEKRDVKEGLATAQPEKES